MKLNLDYYNEAKDKKILGEEYEEVLEKVEDVREKSIAKKLGNHAKIKNILALSELRQNILSWYNFEENASILELNGNYGEITGMLCERAKKVVCIESSKAYATIIEKRHSDKENLELIVGNIEDIKIDEKFNYIIIMDMAKNIEQAINYAKEHLQENGKILLAVNNKFGIRAFSTTKEEEKVVCNNELTITKNKLEELLTNMHYEIYYPLPNFKMPNIIYTKNSMPNLSNIYRDLTYKDENVNYKEVDAYREIIKNDVNDFIYFANSFLLEIAKEEIPKKDIRFISFSNIRKEEYRIKTIVKGKEVYKYAANKKSKKHIDSIKKNIDTLKELGINTLDSYDEEKIVSQYVEAKTLEDKLIEILKEQGKEKFIQKIKEYEQFLKDKLPKNTNIEKNVFQKYKIEENKELEEKLTFTKYGLWDLIFQNCFVLDNSYYFYDQEWQEENIPIEYIIYRAIIYFSTSKTYITDQEIFEGLDLVQYVELFKKLDDKIQEKIRNPLMWNIHMKEEIVSNKYRKLKNEILNKENEILSLKSELEELKNENNKKTNALTIMENSLSWKITKPLRKIKRKLEKK